VAHAPHNGPPEWAEAARSDNDDIGIDLFGDLQYAFINPATDNGAPCDGYIWRGYKAANVCNCSVYNFLSTRLFLVTQVIEKLFWSWR
jgi:hypothetical protein